MIARKQIQQALGIALDRSRIVLLVGPRQCGKTTLARQRVPVDSANYFDLENPADLARLDEPMTALEPLEGLVIIDEVQRRPDLFPILRVLADRETAAATFLVLGSASGDLQRQSSESLAGRVEQVSMGGFNIREVEDSARLWLRGGLPLSYLASDDADSAAWRGNFVQTLLERDLGQWGVRVPAEALRRFWTMLAHYHGQTWNAAEPARALSVDQKTARRYLDLLTDAFMIRQLQPWYANIGKRQVKSPKVYVRDSGLLHQLLGIGSNKELLSHPKVGASWEGFVIEQVIALTLPDGVYFWATHQGAEIDLLLSLSGRMYGVECKRTDAPRMTPSIRNAIEDVGLERVVVIYPGHKRYRLAEQVEVVPLQTLAYGELLFSN